jgi:hypothetical protein
MRAGWPRFRRLQPRGSCRRGDTFGDRGEVSWTAQSYTLATSICMLGASNTSLAFLCATRPARSPLGPGWPCRAGDRCVRSYPNFGSSRAKPPFRLRATTGLAEFSRSGAKRMMASLSIQKRTGRLCIINGVADQSLAHFFANIRY